MPKSKMQEIDIRKVLIDASDLFKEHDSITIKIQDEINECLFISLTRHLLPRYTQRTKVPRVARGKLLPGYRFGWVESQEVLEEG